MSALGLRSGSGSRQPQHASPAPAMPLATCPISSNPLSVPCVHKELLVLGQNFVDTAAPCQQRAGLTRRDGASGASSEAGCNG